MGKRLVHDCDRCGAKEIGEDGSLSIHVGYSPCPAGGPSEQGYEQLDLCPKCMAALLKRLVADDKVDGATLVAMAREKPKGKG